VGVKLEWNGRGLSQSHVIQWSVYERLYTNIHRSISRLYNLQLQVNIGDQYIRSLINISLFALMHIPNLISKITDTLKMLYFYIFIQVQLRNMKSFMAKNQVGDNTKRRPVSTPSFVGSSPLELLIYTVLVSVLVLVLVVVLVLFLFLCLVLFPVGILFLVLFAVMVLVVVLVVVVVVVLAFV